MPRRPPPSFGPASNSRTLTFRSGGTSLSGQAGTDIVVDTRHHFRTVSITPDGSVLTAGPGTTISRANASLRRLGRVLGPDPASDVACTIGGIVANNSSGMTCGTHANPYATLDSLIVVLPSGTILDTGAPKATEKLRRLEPGLYAGLASLRARVRTDPQMAATIRRRFSMKNTMGYAVNALLDYEDPLDILAHLLVGSEGTLGFVSEARFRTLPIPAHVGTALLTFPTLAAATESLPTLVDSGLAVIELMDAASLRVAQGLAGTPDTIAGLHVEDHAALLVEHHADSADELADRMEALGALTADLRLVTPIAIATEAAEKARLWKVRKGLYASVAGSRPSGTTALLEDVCVPVDRLLATCEGLTELFAQHSYDSSVIFGHARDGNIHFLVNERFSERESLARYEAFTADMVDLVLAQDGNLKAEHGTGRMMAPYVERQYGRDLYQVMREIKRLIDPDGLLSPGVVLPVEGASTVIDVRSLKLPVTVESEVDRCVECGFCEPGCPSKDITLTPRQRITVRRDMVALRAAGDTAAADELERDYEYAGIDTCAVDGMCGLACPVSINTGDLTRRLRREKANPVLAATWGLACPRLGSRYARRRVRPPGGRRVARPSRHRHHDRRSQGGQHRRHAALRRHAARRGLATRSRQGGRRDATGCVRAGVHPDDVRPRSRWRWGDGCVPRAVRARWRHRRGAQGHRQHVLRDAVEVEGVHRRLRAGERPHPASAVGGLRPRAGARRRRCRELYRGLPGDA